MAGEAKPKPPKFELEVYEEIDMVTKYFRVLYEPNPDYVDVVRYVVSSACDICLLLVPFCPISFSVRFILLIWSGTEDDWILPGACTATGGPPLVSLRVCSTIITQDMKVATQTLLPNMLRLLTLALAGAKANVLSLYSFACFFVGFNCYYRRYFLRVPLAASRAQARVHCQDCFREEWDVAALMKKFGIRPGINRKQFIEHFGDAPEPVRQYLFAPGEGTATLNLHNVDDGVKMIRRKPKK